MKYETSSQKLRCATEQTLKAHPSAPFIYTESHGKSVKRVIGLLQPTKPHTTPQEAAAADSVKSPHPGSKSLAALVNTDTLVV